MMTEKESGSVLVVSGTDKGREYLIDLLPKSIYDALASVASAGEAKRLLLQKPFDLVIINAPLTDEYGLELAIHVAEDTSAGVMILVKADAYEQAMDKVEDFGVLTVPKPNSRQAILQAVRLTAATRARLRAVERENLRLKNKMEELRIVSRAKWALIENEHLSESAAHRMIEKLAMDERKSRRQVAEEMITRYQKANL